MVRFALLVLVLFGPTVSLAAPAPHLVTDTTKYDFGVVQQGEKVETTFSFRNDGDAPLLIDRVKSSCSCTATLISNKEIPPGGSGSVKAVFDSTRFRGRVHKMIFLYSNDPQRSSAEFLLEGEVAVALQPSPTLLNFGTVTAGQERPLTLVLKNLDREPLRIVKIRTSNAAVQVQWSETELAPGAELAVTVTAAPVAATRTLAGMVLIRTDRAKGAEYEVPVRGRVQSAPVPVAD